MVWIIILVWIVCGIFSHGIAFPCFQKRVPEDYDGNLKSAIAIGVLGPIGLCVCLYFVKTESGAWQGLRWW